MTKRLAFSLVVLWVWGILFLALHWHPTAFDTRWGFDAFSALSLSTRIIITAAVLLLMVPHVGRGVLAGIQRFIDCGRRLGPALPLAALAFVTVGLWGLRSHFLSLDSDGMDWISMAEAGQRFHFKEPGATLLFHAAHQTARPVSPYALDTIAVVVSLCGVVFFAFLIAFARQVTRPGTDRVLLFCLVALTGMIQVLFGHVETYGPLLAAMMAYFYFGARCLRGRSDLLAPGLALGVAVTLHLSTVLLVPSLLILAVLRPGHRERNVGLSVSAAALPLAVLMGLVAYWGYDGPEAGFGELGGWDSILFVSLLAKPENETHMRLLDARHVAFLANEVLFIMPAVIPGLVLSPFLRRGTNDATRRIHWMLAAASVPWLGFLLFFNPDLGSLDWDLFAACALPVMLWLGSSLLVSADETDAPCRRHAALVLIALCALHTIPVLTHSASLPPSSKYFAVGRFYWIDGKLNDAERYYRRGLGLEPDSWMGHEALGDAYADMGKFEDARREWETSLRLNPRNAHVKQNLARLREMER